MRAIVTKSDELTDTFGNVMGINVDSEVMILTIGYAISNNKYPNNNFVKRYVGDWKKVEIINESPRWNDEVSRDWATPELPL